MPSPTFERGVELLRGSLRFTPSQIESLANHLAEAPDEALFRMNPLAWAGTRGMEEKAAVDLFLHATHAGLLEFNWGVLCPNCRGFLTTPGALRSLKRKRTCTLCDCEVPAEDDSLEVSFTVAPAVRRIRFHSPEGLDYREDARRIIFSPSLRIPAEVEAYLRSAVLTWGRAAPGETAALEVDLEPGGYRLAVPSQHAWFHLSVEEGAPPGPLEVDLVDGQLAPFKATAAPGPLSLRVKNRTSHPVMVGLSRAAKGMRVKDVATLVPYLSGKRMVTTQAFRDLFRSESVPSEAGLEFKNLTVLFTDLKGSTQLYERIGDFNAYGLVREHFDVLRRIIDASGGSMVKTIGDAIMASFAEVEPAMEAATRMREDISRVGKGELSLKVGVHAGPCIAVELNEQLDYFGQTVNVAARVQGLAAGGEIVCTEPVWTADGVQAQVRKAHLAAARDTALLKGVEGEVTVFRLRAEGGQPG